MSTLTKKWLQQTIAELEEERDAVPGVVNEDAAMSLAAMKLALASLEAEPYGYVHKAAYEQAGSCGLSSDHEAYRDSSTHIAVYTAPPAPVAMKDHQIRDLVNELRDIAVEYYGTQQLRERIAKTVRAAMLQAGNSPVIPDGWVACSERMPEQFVEVLVCTEDGSRYVAALNQSMNWDDGDFFDDIQYVTHWMPLPAAPQQEAK